MCGTSSRSQVSLPRHTRNPIQILISIQIGIHQHTMILLKHYPVKKMSRGKTSIPALLCPVADTIIPSTIAIHYRTGNMTSSILSTCSIHTSDQLVRGSCRLGRRMGSPDISRINNTLHVLDTSVQRTDNVVLPSSPGTASISCFSPHSDTLEQFRSSPHQLLNEKCHLAARLHKLPQALLLTIYATIINFRPKNWSMLVQQWTFFVVQKVLKTVQHQINKGSRTSNRVFHQCFTLLLSLRGLPSTISHQMHSEESFVSRSVETLLTAFVNPECTLFTNGTPILSI